MNMRNNGSNKHHKRNKRILIENHIDSDEEYLPQETSHNYTRVDEEGKEIVNLIDEINYFGEGLTDGDGLTDGTYDDELQEYDKGYNTNFTRRRVGPSTVD